MARASTAPRQDRVCDQGLGMVIWLKMVRLEGESLNSLIDTLQEWENHLARLDSKSLRCEDDTFAP